MPLLLRCHYAPEAAYYVTAYTAASDAVTTGTYTLGTPFYRFVPSVAEISESKCLYFQNQTDADAYAVKHQGTVTAYPTGQCYYYIWLRHAYNSELGGIMEFGTVRNNIYRVCIEGISGAGTPTPDPLEPEELKARIYVKRWVEVVHPTIYM